MNPIRCGRVPALGVTLGLMFLAGCGASGTSGPGAGGTPTPTTATPNQVTVTTDKQQYGPGDTVSVTIVNGLSTGIVTADHQTNCTTVTLEWWAGGQGWQAQNLCKLKTATRLIPIAPGGTMMQQLQPQGGAAPGWATGTYRIAFSYYVGSVGSISGSPTTIHSASFIVS